VAVDESNAEEHLGFELETEGLGRVCCRPLNLKLLFKFTDLIKSAPDTVPDFVCSLLSVVGERRDAAVPEGRAISREQAKTLTDQELEQFAARFLEATNWIGPGGKAEPAAEGGEECSYGQRLKRTFVAYEKGLAEQSGPYPLLDSFSDAASGESEYGWRLVAGGSSEAEKPAFSDPVKEIFTGFSNGGLEQWHRAVGVPSAKLTRLFANIAEKWQTQNSRIAQHIGESLASLEDKIRAHLNTLRAEANEWATKMVYHRVLLGVVIFVAIIDLLSPVFLYFIVRANSRVQEFAAMGNLADTVRSLSERMDAQTRELTELIKQHDAEQVTAAQQTTHLDVNRPKGREKHPHDHSSFSGKHRRARNTHPSNALKLSQK
jgi:hypothetical protein